MGILVSILVSILASILVGILVGRQVGRLGGQSTPEMHRLPMIALLSSQCKAICTMQCASSGVQHVVCSMWCAAAHDCIAARSLQSHMQCAACAFPVCSM